jgi:Ser/Thr protein kinase RdoA (MazF antagonist)
MDVVPILTSLLDPHALAQRVEGAYGLQDVQCQLITATLRDVYLVASRTGRSILIVYRHGERTWDTIAAEWQFVGYLAEHAVPVAPALAALSGEQILTLQTPEGVRYAVVTTFVSGQHLRRRPSVKATHRYGEIIATLHQLADQAPDSFARATPDIAGRLEKALLGIRALVGAGLSEQAYLEHCGQELLAHLHALPKAPPTYGIIHGDAIRANALVGDDGSVTLIDFDWYGLGWRAYDIASYLLTIRGSADEQPLAEAFLAGYTAVRPLVAREQALLPLFEAVRALLEIGTPALQVNRWGSAYLESFFTQSLQQLKRAMQQITEG